MTQSAKAAPKIPTPLATHTEDRREIFAVNDMLELRHHDSPALLKQLLVAPARVELLKATRYEVVVAGEQQVEHRECRVFVHSLVSCGG